MTIRAMPEDAHLVEQRHAWLLERVAADRRVTTADAAAFFTVSVDTIRRDLRHLHDRGLLRRVHGGAVPIARLPDSFSERAARPSTSSLAADIVERFRPGQLIGLDGGTTCVEIASMIPSSLAVTVVTNNPAAAVALSGHPNANVMLLGGHLDLTWMATTGADTVDAWRNYRLDIGVLGVCGIERDVGVTTNSSNEVATKRALIAASTDIIVPIHHDKVGVRASFVVAGFESLDVVVTDAALPNDLERAITSEGNQVAVPRKPA